MYNVAGLFDSTIESEDSGRVTSEEDTNKYYLENLFESIVESEGYNSVDELRLSPLFSSVTESEDEMPAVEEPNTHNLADLFASDSEEKEEYEINEYEPIREIEETTPSCYYELFGCDIQDLEEKDNLMTNAVCLVEPEIEQAKECWALANCNPVEQLATELYGCNISLLSETLFYYFPQRSCEFTLGDHFVQKMSVCQYFGLDLVTGGATVEEIEEEEEEEIQEDIKIEETQYVPTLFGADLSHFSEPIFSYYPYRSEELQAGCNVVPPTQQVVIEEEQVAIEEELITPTLEEIEEIEAREWAHEFRNAHNNYQKEQNEKELNEFLCEAEQASFNYVVVANE